MTEKLFYKDAYLKEFDAVVTDVKHDSGKMAVTLDVTAFYPEGGGQGADHGLILTKDHQSFSVTDVQERDGEILHYVSCPDGAGIRPQDKVRCFIDWDRRFDHMQQHSGEHIVSGMICASFNCNNVGFHLGEDTVTIDFDTRISPEQALEIENRANSYIWEDHPVVESWPDRKELSSIQYRSKKEIEGDVRLIAFPGADICACCGIHVSGSAQVGLVKFISAKNFHEGTRLELLCGKRAVRYLSGVYVQAKAAAVKLSTSEENLAEHVEKLASENIRLKTGISDAMSRLFVLQAKACEGKGNVLVIADDITGVQARELADLISEKCEGTAAVFAGNGDRYNYAVINKKGFPKDFVKMLNSALDGKGGGKDGFAQGCVCAGREAVKNHFHDYFEL